MSYLDLRMDGTWIDCPTDSRYRLPVLRLVKRLNKGSFKISRADVYEGEYSSTLYLKAAISQRNLTFSTRIPGSDLYRHRIEELALAVERNFNSQVTNTRRIIEQMKRRVETRQST